MVKNQAATDGCAHLVVKLKDFAAAAAGMKP